ncbi:MAG: DUF1553 domain-containing protein [Fuerstiella sp.]|nr:DUF1553 domain-containing protein [Fuerstiella sp.]
MNLDRNFHRLPVVAFSALIVFASSVAQAQESGNEQTERAGVSFFETKIRPVLVEHCYECHSATADNVKGGLLLDTRKNARQGGDSGSAVVPNDVDESLLVSALKHESFEMPPTGRLPDSVINDFVRWIEMGAIDPREGEAAANAEIDFKQARRHWAYQPIVQPEYPEVQQSDWPANAIDHFTLARMEDLGLHPVDAAGKKELIRRATFDLIGLPPKPEAIADFLKDDSATAFRDVVDRLLKSAHYGERWGRYWLDIARYSEDQAHTFSVTQNTNGFRFRDWVVDAFNSDMPYDKFVKLQIAGDLIGPDGNRSYNHLVALGFFGLGAQYYKNTDKERAAADELDDRVDTLTRGFLGLTVSCARCHDHKFDPIPTQDYYSLAGIFRSSRLHNAPLCEKEDVDAYNAGQQHVKNSEAALKKFLAEEKSAAAEAKVAEIARYMKTVWEFQQAAASGKPVEITELSTNAELNEFLLKRWIAFLDPKQKGNISALNPWFDLVTVEALSTSNEGYPVNVAEVATAFQERVQRLLNVRDGIVTTNLVESNADMPHEPGHPRFVTPLVTKLRPTAGIDVDITGATQLFLVVSDGGNGKSCDHADWLEPRLVGAGNELKLTELKWKTLEGFSGGRIDKNYQGQPLKVGGKTYPGGIGVHAPTVIAYDLPEGYVRFQAIGGLDNSGSDQGGCGEQASIQFSVYTEKPVEGPISTGNDLLTKVLGKDGPLSVSDADLEQFLTGRKKEQFVRLQTDSQTAKTSAPPMYPIAHSYAESGSADMHVYIRGNPARKREVAPRRFLRVLAGADRPHFQNGSGRRELADAIASPENPLTARVIVNRIWQHHFGRGIVATPSNFGTLGETPTHPRLLNYLAARFIESGWSIKTLHREIMLSATYQLSTTFDQTNAEIDADNRFLWQMGRKRLDIEAWRDALLDVSGQLNRTMRGPSLDLADSGNDRRTIYAKISRHELDSLLRLFDFPDANITSSKRTETTVAQQQLFVLNSPFMIARAKAFAARLQREVPENDEDRIRRAFLLAYGRPPSDVEAEIGVSYLRAEADPENDLSQWQSYAQVLLGSNEFMYLD